MRDSAVNNVAVVVLAAGEGTRMKAKRKNKVAFHLGGRPMISYTINTIRKAGFHRVILVVKFQENSVRKAVGNSVSFIRQGEKAGTAAALESALSGLKTDVSDVIVMYGDDSAFYTPDLLHFLLEEHRTSQAAVTLLSINLPDPTGLGRIVRDEFGAITSIVEEKDASASQKLIREINTGCYCFRTEFLRQRLAEIKPNPSSGEYYLTDIVGIALQHLERVHVCLYDNSRVWFGINNRSQWAKARRLMQVASV